MKNVGLSSLHCFILMPDDAVNELSGLVAHSEDSSLSSSSEILATLCRYGGDREVAARGLKAARDGREFRQVLGSTVE